jgi:hypothetical protein
MKLPMKQMRPHGVDLVCWSGVVMPCKSCGSLNQSKFNGEIVIHSRGLKNIDKPAVFVFAEIDVCLVCRSAEFTVPVAELRLLEKGHAAAASKT